MSHVATVDVEIKDLDALAAACNRLGLELVRGQQTYRWYGQSVGDYPLPDGFAKHELGQCDHALRVVNAEADAHGQMPYEIGVCARRDGRTGYALLWDFFCGGFGLQERVGEDCKKLRQAYATEVARKSAIANGFRVSEQQTSNGAIRLVLSK